MALTHAILVSLCDRPCSGYDLAKQFDGSVGYFWKATHQQIYRELSKLENDGLISAEVIAQESRPDKKLFTVTPTGQTALVQWLAEPCEPPAFKEDLLVKIFAGHLTDAQVILQEIDRHRQLHQERLATYQAIEQQFFSDPENQPLAKKFQYLTLRRGIRYEGDYLAWCEEATEFINRMSRTCSPFDRLPSA